MDDIDENDTTLKANFLDDLGKDLGIKKTDENQKTAEELAAEASAAEEDRLAEEAKQKAGGKEEELVPDFSKKAAKPNKDDSIATLRKQRDEERERNKAFTEVFGEHKPEAIKPLLEYVTEVIEGPITPEAVQGIITDLKGLKDQSTKLQQEIEERERRITDLDIRSSKDFNDKFQEPYKEAVNNVFLTFASIAEDKTIVAPKATSEFHRYLLDHTDIDGVDAKLALNKFAKAYRDESGEEPELPSITDLMKAVREFRSKKASLQDAYVNWKTKKEEEAKNTQAAEQIQKDAVNKSNRKKRVDLSSKAFREFDDKDNPFGDDVSEIFNEEFKFGEDIFDGKEIPPYNELLTRGVKARLWDKHKDKIAELIAIAEASDKGERNFIKGQGRQVSGKQEKGKDWLAGAL